MVINTQVMVVMVVAYYDSIFVSYGSIYDLESICIFHNLKRYLTSTFYCYRITFPSFFNKAGNGKMQLKNYIFTILIFEQLRNHTNITTKKIKLNRE